MYKINSSPQGEDAWFQARLGKWTASMFSKALTPTGKPSTQAEEVNRRLVAEMIIGEPDQTFCSDSMARGSQLEPEALGFLKLVYGYDFEPCGFVDSGKGYGCSPDAIDKTQRVGLEIKCPEAHTHIKYLALNDIPKEYLLQVQGSLWVMDDFKEWVFCSYHPFIKPLVIVVKRDEDLINALSVQVLRNVQEVKSLYERLKNV